jgi:ribosomal protein L37AE/L43A
MNKYQLKQKSCPSCGKRDLTEFTRYENVCACANCGFKLFGCFTDEEMAQNNLLDEIKETIGMIERDLDPFARGDAMNYTGYLSENAADLKDLVSKLVRG